MKNLILGLTVLLVCSCNELQKDKASKDGVVLPFSDALQIRTEVNSAPDSLTAFLWPSVEYYERQTKAGVISAVDYQDYVAQVSANVFLFGDEFDEWIITYLSEGRELETTLEEIGELKKPVLEKMKPIANRIRNLRKEAKTLKSKIRKIKKDVKKKKVVVATASTNVETAKAEFDALVCTDVLTDDTHADFGKCTILKTKLDEVKVILAEAAETYDAAKKLQKEKEADLKHIEKVEIKKATAEKKKIQKEELQPLLDKEEEADNRLAEILIHQSERIGLVQENLDPHSVTLARDEDGEIILNSYGFPDRTVDSETQVNWIKTYETTADEKNVFDIRRKKITIKLGEWGENAQSYETKYDEDEFGNFTLANDSEIYDVSLDGEDVVRFKFKEKDRRGNVTGRIYSFELQRSPFDIHVRLLGDIVVTYRGEVERRGQIKVILTKKTLDD